MYLYTYPVMENVSTFLNVDSTTIDNNFTVEKVNWTLSVDSEIVPNTLQLIIMWVVGIGNIVMNIPVYVIVPRMQTLPEATATAILSLAVSDTLMGCIVTIRLVTFLTEGYTLLSWHCILDSVGIATAGTVSILNLVFLFLDRYFVIKLPLRYETVMTKRKILQLQVAFWITSILLTIPPNANLFGMRVKYFKHGFFCSIDVHSNIVISVMGLINAFFAPLIIIMWCSIGIYVIARRQIAAMDSDSPNPERISVSKRNKRVVRTLICMVTGFYVFWFPNAITFFILEMVNRPMTSPFGRFACTYLGAANSLVNPLIYIPTIKEYRNLILKVFFRQKMLTNEQIPSDNNLY